MPVAKSDEYYEAVQIPQVAFADPDLKTASVETDQQGLPKPYSGGFTVTFKMKNTGKDWAVRCMVREVAELEFRYRAITDFFKRNNFSYFIGTSYLQNGIRVNGVYYPIIKMNWVSGDTLSVYLSKHYNDPIKTHALLNDFVKMVTEMTALGIAHGDLQHGNIIVKNNKLFLIDYDGMYLPALHGLRSNELGHGNYQHPQRTAAHFNEKTDRFSSIIIYLSLYALQLKPSLWPKYHKGENLLITSQDIQSLSDSDVIRELKAMPELTVLVERFIGVCHLAIDNVPSLQDFVNGAFAYNKNNLGKIAVNTSLYKVIDGRDKSAIQNHFGQRVEVVARINNIYERTTSHRQPCTFLNVGEYPHQTFTFTLWSEGLRSLEAAGISYASLKWISVTGVISRYFDRMQMIIENASQIQVLDSEAEALSRLTKVSTAVTPKKLTNTTASVFGEVYENNTANTSTPKPVSISLPAPKQNTTPKQTIPPNQTTTPKQSTPPAPVAQPRPKKEKPRRYKSSAERKFEEALLTIGAMVAFCAIWGAFMGGWDGAKIGAAGGVIFGILAAIQKI